jgi:hypothetical protein
LTFRQDAREHALEPDVSSHGVCSRGNVSRKQDDIEPE